MKFRFTNHAQYRMHSRGISASIIKEIINSPDFTQVQNNGKILKIKNVSGKGRIAAVYRKERDNFVIITVYYEN